MNEEVYKDSLSSRLSVHLVGQPTSGKDQHFSFQKNSFYVQIYVQSTESAASSLYSRFLVL